MRKTNPNAWRERDESAHGLIDYLIAQGYAATGQDYIRHGIDGHEKANEFRLKIARGLEHYGYARAVRVIDTDGNPCNPAEAQCMRPDAPHGISMRFHRKEDSRTHIAHESQGNPENLKYNPFQRRRQPRY